ncbi:MAG: ROK family protein [Christensenellales bacterium]|jgi:predicted NBD/HSP70 family sugar kinase
MKKLKRKKTGNPELIRKINIDLIINLIIEFQPISRSEIAKRSGLALPTVMRIVDILIANEILVEVGPGDSTGGRKPTMIQMNESHTYYIGVCIQRKLKVVLANAVGKIISRHESVFNYQQMSANAFEQISSGIQSVINKANVNINNNCFIGIGTPGSSFKHTIMVDNFPFAKWATFDINKWLQENPLPYPAICENIPKLGAMAELRFGSGQNISNFIYIYADFGVGSGLVANGEIYMGSSGVAGELGHMIIEHDGVECYCGNRGCVEMYSSSLAILSNVRKAMSNYNFTVNGISDANKVQFPDALEELNQGNARVEKIFCEAGYYLGIAMANLINLFNPYMIIIGGELSDCACYVQAAKNQALKHIFLHKAEHVIITTSKLGRDDLLKGAVALAMNKRLSLL